MFLRARLHPIDPRFVPSIQSIFVSLLSRERSLGTLTSAQSQSREAVERGWTNAEHHVSIDCQWVGHLPRIHQSVQLPSALERSPHWEWRTLRRSDQSRPSVSIPRIHFEFSLGNLSTIWRWSSAKSFPSITIDSSDLDSPIRRRERRRVSCQTRDDRPPRSQRFSSNRSTESMEREDLSSSNRNTEPEFSPRSSPGQEST